VKPCVISSATKPAARLLNTRTQGRQAEGRHWWPAGSGADEREPASGVEAGQGQQGRSRGGWARHRANRPSATQPVARDPPSAAGRHATGPAGTQGDDSQTGREPARAGHPDGAGSADPASTAASAATPDRPTFSEHSHGFRPGRRAHDAVKAARAYVQSGKRVVVDVDLANSSTGSTTTS
jgi:hypothetical protein